MAVRRIVATYTVAAGRMRRSSTGWGTASGGSGGAERFQWRRILNLFHIFVLFGSFPLVLIRLTVYIRPEKSAYFS
jgi:hypothetical protein